MMKGQADEFVIVLLAALVFIGILALVWTSETKLTVTPESKYLTVARGTTSSFPISLNGTATNVSLKASGEIANWITFDRPSLDVKDYEEVRVIISVPATASYGFHNGDIYVESFGFQERVSLVINVSTYTIEKETRSISLGDLTVSYSIGPETIAERENLRIERGYFTDISASFAAVISEEKLPMVTDGYIQLIVDQTNGLGNLIVEVNGNETFNQKAGIGEMIIPLSKDQIKKSNSVVLRAGTPGLAFWSSSTYTIASAKFVVEYNGTVFKDVDFVLDNLEVVNFKSGRVSFIVKKYDINKLNDLLIKINGRTIFEGVPTLVYFSKTFGNDVPLNIGTNTISFSVEPDTFYELKDVTLTITRYS